MNNWYSILYVLSQSFAVVMLVRGGHLWTATVLVGLMLGVGVVWIFRRPLRHRILLWIDRSVTRGLYEEEEKLMDALSAESKKSEKP